LLENALPFGTYFKYAKWRKAGKREGLGRRKKEGDQWEVLVSCCASSSSPVVHEDVGFPDASRWDSQVLDATKLGRIPPQIVIVPILSIPNQN
jgi:hypothetical protein